MLTIFIDALSYKVASDLFARDESLFLNSKPKRLKAGAGYSSNLHWQLFAGKSASDVGFFCDWGIKTGQSFDEKMPTLHRLLSKTDDNTLFNSVVRIARRVIARVDDNIPWSQRRHFSRCGSYLFSASDAKAVNERTDLGAIETGDYRTTLAMANKAISAGQDSVLAVINELDGLGHEIGGSHKGYAELAQEILAAVAGTVAIYREKFPGQRVRMLSDHGMHDVNYSVDPLSSVARTLGPPGNDYLALTDSVYLRAWFRSEQIAEEFKAAIGKVTCLRTLSTSEREDLGIQDPRFGELIAVLEDGAVFAPNMFSLWIRGGPRGMHGYLSENPWSCGFYVDDGPSFEASFIAPSQVAERGACA